jgi:ATP-dependent DNA ligase
MIRAASDGGNATGLVYYAFDLLQLNGRDLMKAPLIERKDVLERMLAGAPAGLQFSGHVLGNGPAFLRHACKMGSKASSRNGSIGPICLVIAAPGSRASA